MQPIRMGMPDLQWATAVLTQAFDGEVPIPDLFREPRAAAKTAYFMECSCRYALLFGECHASVDRSGVAMWLVPGATRMTPLRMFRAGMFAAPLRLGLRDFNAFGAFAKHTDAVHQKAIPQPHYYLLGIGVHPHRRGQGVGRALLEPMLDRARLESVPIYLETQCERNVALYRRIGFEVVDEAPIAGLGIRNWGMVWR